MSIIQWAAILLVMGFFIGILLLLGIPSFGYLQRWWQREKETLGKIFINAIYQDDRILPKTGNDNAIESLNSEIEKCRSDLKLTIIKHSELINLVSQISILLRDLQYKWPNIEKIDVESLIYDESTSDANFAHLLTKLNSIFDAINAAISKNRDTIIDLQRKVQALKGQNAELILKIKELRVKNDELLNSLKLKDKEITETRSIVFTAHSRILGEPKTDIQGQIGSNEVIAMKVEKLIRAFREIQNKLQAEMKNKEIRNIILYKEVSKVLGPVDPIDINMDAKVLNWFDNYDVRYLWSTINTLREIWVKKIIKYEFKSDLIHTAWRISQLDRAKINLSNLISASEILDNIADPNYFDNKFIEQWENVWSPILKAEQHMLFFGGLSRLPYNAEESEFLETLAVMRMHIISICDINDCIIDKIVLGIHPSHNWDISHILIGGESLELFKNIIRNDKNELVGKAVQIINWGMRLRSKTLLSEVVILDMDISRML